MAYTIRTTRFVKGGPITAATVSVGRGSNYKRCGRLSRTRLAWRRAEAYIAQQKQRAEHGPLSNQHSTCQGDGLQTVRASKQTQRCGHAS